MRENRLTWLGHIHRRPIVAIVKRIDCLKVIGTSSERGRPKKTWLETVNNDLKAFNGKDYFKSNRIKT